MSFSRDMKENFDELNGEPRIHKKQFDFRSDTRYNTNIDERMFDITKETFRESGGLFCVF